MCASLGRIVSDYAGLLEICRQRAVELDISRSGIDHLSGLPNGHAGKLLGAKQKKKLGVVSLGLMLETLGLKILIIEDEAATARTISLRTPVDRCNQRFGNKCNSPKLLAPRKQPALVSSPPQSPPTASRAHLRVIQSKRSGRSKYG